jgi:hypothetical protein
MPFSRLILAAAPASGAWGSGWEPKAGLAKMV